MQITLLRVGKLLLKIELNGIPALSKFFLTSKDSLKYKTFICRNMLDRGYLASTELSVSIRHTKEIVDAYLENLDKFSTLIKKHNNKGCLDEFLEGPFCIQGFNSLNEES